MDYGDCGIFLEIVEFIPDGSFLEPSRFVRQYVFRNIFQKFAEDVVKRHKVDEFRRVFLIDRRNHLDDILGDVVQFRFVIPDRIEHLQELRALRSFKTRYHIHQIVAALYAQIYRRE